MAKLSQERVDALLVTADPTFTIVGFELLH